MQDWLSTTGWGMYTRMADIIPLFSNPLPEHRHDRMEELRERLATTSLYHPERTAWWKELQALTRPAGLHDPLAVDKPKSGCGHPLSDIYR